MDVKKAGSSLDSLISSFNTRIADLQELVIARNSESTRKSITIFLFLNQTATYYFYCFSSLRVVYPVSTVVDLSAIDAAVKAVELQVQAIKSRVREETEAIPKAKVLYFSTLSCQLGF